VRRGFDPIGLRPAGPAPGENIGKMEDWNDGSIWILFFILKDVFHFKTPYSTIPPFHGDERKLTVKALQFYIRYRNNYTYIQQYFLSRRFLDEHSV
jgi:hypothetical protein